MNVYIYEYINIRAGCAAFAPVAVRRDQIGGGRCVCVRERERERQREREIEREREREREEELMPRGMCCVWTRLGGECLGAGA